MMPKARENFFMILTILFKDLHRNPILPVVVVNRYPVNTSAYRWVTDIVGALEKPPTVLNMVDNDPRWNLEHIGSDFKAKFHSNLFNAIFRKYSYSSLAKFLKTLEQDSIIHYTNEFSGTYSGDFSRTAVSFQDDLFGERTLTSRAYSKKIIKASFRAKYIITNTEVLREKIVQKGYGGEVRAIHLSVSTSFKPLKNREELRSFLGLPPDKILLLSVSSLDSRKNLMRIKKAASLLGNNYELVRVGPDIGEGISFQNVDDQTLNKIYNACDVLVFPSLYEGFGLPIIEAFASGIPVVTSDIPEIKEVSGGCAELVDPLSTESIVSGIRNAINDSEYLIKKGIERAGLFHLDNFRKKLLNLYTEMSE